MPVYVASSLSAPLVWNSGVIVWKFSLFFQQKRFHIGQDETGIERAGTVDLPDAVFVIDEKDAHGVVKGIAFITGLAVG